MSQPEVVIEEIDGAIGVLPDGKKIMALVGVSSSGPVNVPAAFARPEDVIATYGAGPLVQAACDHIDRTGEPVLICRCAASVAGEHGDLDDSGVTGTSVVTISAGDTTPNDDYEPYFEVIKGGTVGQAGIEFVWSLDGGRTKSVATALGTANSFVFPDSGGIGYDFAAGTLVAGDVVHSRAVAPSANGVDLGAAIAALGLSAQPWECVEIASPIGANEFDAIETAIGSLNEKLWIANTRIPDVGETEAAYLSSLNSEFGAKASTRAVVCAGACRLTSAADQRKYTRPIVFAVAPLLATCSEEIDISAPALGALRGVAIRDQNGNPIPGLHDESVNPGLDDARFTVLRTFADELKGVFVNNPRLFSSPGSDFEFSQHRRVFNLARFALRLFFVRRLSQGILVNASTGFILETEAKEIEEAADAAMRSVLLAKPKASGGGQDGKRDRFVKVSRTDNILATKTIHVQASVIPLAYPKRFVISLGFKNPVVQIV